MSDTMEDLKAKLQEAALEADTQKILALAKEVAKLESSERQAKEETLKGIRSEFVDSVVKAIKPVLAKFAGDKLEDLGGTIRIVYDPSESDLLTVAVTSATAAKTVSHATSSGDGKPGKLRGLYGKSLDEMFHEVATPDEIEAHEAKEGNSAKYALKNRVVQAAIEAGKFTTIA